MLNILNIILFILFLSTPIYAQPSTVLVQASVSDDDTTIYSPTNIGFNGAQISAQGSGVLVTIAGGGGGD